jgi:hypothetical protein
MASAFSAVGDFIKSIYELILSMFQTFFGLLNTLLSTIVNFFTSILQLFGDTTKGVFSVLGGVGNFLIGKLHLREYNELQANIWCVANAAIIGVVAVGGYAYLAYQRRQGQPVVVNGKKLN